MAAAAVYRRRVSRRAALAVGGTALLIACGGSEDKPGTQNATVSSGASSATGPGAGAATTVAQPKPGGILKTSSTQDVPSFDPLAARAAITNSIGSYYYSRLLKFKPGRGAFADGTLEGDLITRWEQPDPLTTIMHLRDGVKLDARAPTNGRTLTTEDVALSWEKFATTGTYRSDLVQSVNKDAPIVSFRAASPTTIEIKSSFPDGQMLPSMNFWGGFWVVPKEGLTGGFDPATTTRGSGPWLLDRYQASVGFTFKKNPNYYDAANSPLLDGIEMPIIGDTAQVEAQFKARNIFVATGGRGGVIPSANVLGLQRDVRGSRVVLAEPSVEGPTISFSWRQSNPYRDVRVRRALSMLIDRDQSIEIFNDVKNFQSAGIKMSSYWNTPVSSGWGPYWLDPKSSGFGPFADNFKLNVAEAKKLLTAAGYQDGFETPFTFVAGADYGRDWGQRAEAMMAMLGRGGIRCKANAVDYNAVWIPQYLRQKGDFDGLAMYPNGSRGDPGQWLHVFFASAGANNQVAQNFPALDALILKQRQELDRQKRIAVFHEIQRYFAEHMPTVPQGGNSEVPTLVWNGLHGPGELRGWPGGTGGAETLPFYWLEDSLRS